MKALGALLLLPFWLAPAPLAGAAEYPVKPIRLIIPFAPGGASDIAARTLGQALQRSLSQQIVVDNRPGANGAIAAQAAVNAPADGYTLLWAVASMVALPLTLKVPPFQSLADFTPVSNVGQFAFCMTIHPGVPAKSLAEFTTYARENPDKLNYASSTVSEFKSTSQFMKAAGISMVKVLYKGGAQVMPDLLTGRVQVHFGTMSSALQYANDGRLRMLAVLLPRRSAAAPEVPTFAESGMANVSAPTWQAILAPPKTPRVVSDRLSREIASVLQGAEVRAQFVRQFLQIEGSSPEALATRIDADYISWKQFFRDNGISPE